MGRGWSRGFPGIKFVQVLCKYHLSTLGLFVGEHLSGPEVKKGLKTPKGQVNNLLKETWPSLPRPLVENEERPVSPMEVDCQSIAVGVYSDSAAGELNSKMPISVSNSEHSEQLMETLKQFVHDKLHRTVLSFADFKKLLLLRQTGKSFFVFFKSLWGNIHKGRHREAGR